MMFGSICEDTLNPQVTSSHHKPKRGSVRCFHGQVQLKRDKHEKYPLFFMYFVFVALHTLFKTNAESCAVIILLEKDTFIERTERSEQPFFDDDIGLDFSRD